MKSKNVNREHPYMGKNYRVNDFTNDHKHGNSIPDGETRTRGQMIVQHAAWYLLAEYHKLDRNNWDAFKVLCDAYFKIPKNRITV